MASRPCYATCKATLHVSDFRTTPGIMHRNTRIVVILVVTALVGRAQWLNYHDESIPRTKDGKPNLSAPAPRAPNGKPDLSGVWQAEPTTSDEMKRLFGDIGRFAVPGDDPSTFNKYFISVLADFKFAGPPLRPEFAPLLRQHATGRDHPTSHCLPVGVPANLLVPAPFKIIQTPTVLVTLFEGFERQEQIYIDGRKHPSDPEPLWLGYGSGEWEGDTLVANIAGFNDRSWLDAVGNPHSEALHVAERFRRRDFGHMDVEVTIDDQKVYTQPFTFKFVELLVPDSDVLEYICAENEKDSARLTKQ